MSRCPLQVEISESDRRFRLKPAGGFGPKRSPMAEALRGRLWRTAAAELILSCLGLEKQVLSLILSCFLMMVWSALNCVNNGDKCFKLFIWLIRFICWRVRFAPSHR
jgi:hypothetical protein